MVAVLLLVLLLGLELVCLGLLALLRFRAAGLVLINLQLQRLLVVLGVALTTLQAQVLVLAARVREACLEKIATFCGADAMRKDLPTVPQMGEAVLANLSPPPTDPQEFGQWAQNLTELAEQRVQAERQQGRAEGLVEGKTEGRAEGFQAGDAHGEARGRALGEANALLLVLRSRGVEVSAELEERIMACSDPALLAAGL